MNDLLEAIERSKKLDQETTAKKRKAKANSKVEILDFNYFGQDSGSYDWNAKVVYGKYGKTRTAKVFIDHFNKEIYKGPEDKNHKCLKGVVEAVRESRIGGVR